LHSNSPLTIPLPHSFNHSFIDMKSLCVLLVLAGLATNASAQYQITQWTIDSGGGQSSGGGHVLTGSIGHSAGGTATSATYRLLSGYYGIVALAPAEGGPRLRIGTTAREVILAWPATAKDFQLQVAPSLTQPAWSDVREAAQLVGEEYQVRVPWQSGDRFFRLRKP
jgi:hypothetical protein